MDLFKYTYSRDVLKRNIYILSLIEIVITQTVDVTFVVRYLLNNKYQLLAEEEKLTPEFILIHQTHISKEELLKEIENYNSDDDSVEDFDQYS